MIKVTMGEGRRSSNMPEKWKKRIEFILPSYAIVPILSVFGMNFLAYYGTKLLMRNAEHHDLSIWIDEALPFLPFFVSFYILAYVQWVGSYVFHSRENRKDCYQFAMADIIAKMLCLICFIVIPTEIVRPEITGNGIWDWLTRLIYASDTPRNLFPSIHCLESWVCFRSALQMKRVPRWYVWVQLIFSLFVFASTVLIKQHFVIDILAGVAVVEIGWFLSKRFGLWRFFERIELPFVRRGKSDANVPSEIMGE